MQKYIVTFIAIVSATVLFAQKTPETYMKLIPALPKDSCSATHENVEQFRGKVEQLIDEIQADIDARNENITETVEANKGTVEQKMTNQMTQMYGLSEAEMEKIKNSGDMSEADQAALANKIMMQKTNMSRKAAWLGVCQGCT